MNGFNAPLPPSLQTDEDDEDTSLATQRQMYSRAALTFTRVPTVPVRKLQRQDKDVHKEFEAKCAHAPRRKATRLIDLEAVASPPQNSNSIANRTMTLGRLREALSEAFKRALHH